MNSTNNQASRCQDSTPHDFYTRQVSLGNSEGDVNASEVLDFLNESYLDENQDQDFFEFEYGFETVQRTCPTLGNLFEVPDYKFGQSIHQVSDGQMADECQESLNENLREFSIIRDDLSTSFDSEGEKSRPIV